MFSRIKNLRVQSSKTQKEMASMLNIDQSTYSDYETGKINIPIEALIKLAKCYDTSVDYIVEQTDTPEPYPKKE